ncbi:histidine kinase-like protein [Phanerochaete sordida]|uniref:Histidine kinase-like protein n=1 Tax=Phanerochaete sordida TaxID=48140 RepID=A0A9P3LJS5_9APHY|nr:histidine kinase-like protein [Phanerochaete sordida]
MSHHHTVNGASTLFASGPVGEPVEYHLEELQSNINDDAYTRRRPAQLSEVAVEAFTDVTTPSILDPTLSQELAEPPSNFSQNGIVHLGPIDSPGSARSRSLGSSRGRTSRNSGNASDSITRDMDVVELPSTRRRHSVTSGSASDAPSAGGSGALSGSCDSVGTGTSSEGPHITFRYQHIQDEEGHHLIVGREGKLTRCEDEPIRTPGAVQGFGVLIAVEEEDDGNLTVRQVSENSTEILGLSPGYLFSLECFTQTLTDSQADLLLDNIQYLSDAALTAEEQAENLHVFMLNGFGEPGSALPDEGSQDVQQRRHWNCWVAAHRPEMKAPANLDPASSTPQTLYRNIIILEFELERDPFNPLYPVQTVDERFPSGVSSPSDASGSTDGTNSGSSGRTLVSSGSGTDSAGSENAVYENSPDGSTPSVNNSDPSSTANTSVTSPTPSPSHDEGTDPHEVHGNDEWMPSPEAILESTTTHSKPLLALERLRRNRRDTNDSPASPASFNSGLDRGSGSIRRGGIAARRKRGQGAVGMMDVFAVMAQINEQLGAATDLDTFLKVVVGVMKDLTQFHRVLVYQFDETWNGKVVAELVDWNKTHDLYQGLHFPAADIPAQARQLYALNRVRLLYDRGQPTARLVIRSKKDLETPLDMTHCYLRAMSPIHLKYLGNMGVRASMSVSIMAFGQLWGLVACHSYGPSGMRVSFPVRQMLRLLSQSISRNVERLSLAQRLHTRKLINTMPTDQHPSGYIVSDADDLLGLFDADYGVLVIGEGAKILGPNQHGQEILVVAEYLRMKQFDTMQVSQAVTVDYPDLQLSTGLEVIAGLLYVPLSVGGGDFIAFLRKGQPCQVRWAGRPFRSDAEKNTLEPRKSFKMWSETVAGRSRPWSDEHLETAGVLALVYGKFIEVWRQKESALHATKLTNILLSNASHEVRTPLNHIINYLELALNSQLDLETRENLSQSHAASKSLLFTINDLLDLTRLESGGETSFNEPFNLHSVVHEATLLYRNEASRRGMIFKLDLDKCPQIVIGDAKKTRTVVANLTANAVKYTQEGTVTVECRAFEEPAGLRNSGNIAVEIVVSDTGCGMSPDKLESIFREFEQVETPAATPSAQAKGLGLGLAVVARIVEQLGGQLRVDSRVNEGSRFSFLIPFGVGTPNSSPGSSQRSRTQSRGSRGHEIESLVNALQAHPHPMTGAPLGMAPPGLEMDIRGMLTQSPGTGSGSRSLAVSTPDLGKKASRSKMRGTPDIAQNQRLRILIVEDNDINRTILAKRLTLDGHIVVNTTNGQEGYDMVELDRDFDCVLMDIQMPLLNGYEATERIRALEQDGKDPPPARLSHQLNGRLPIFAVSASLWEEQRLDMYKLGMDGWILKPIDFKRLRVILKGVTDIEQREKDVYTPGCNWELGGWLASPNQPPDETNLTGTS